MTTLVRIQETERQALLRLLDKAKAEGVTIMCDRTDSRHYATSVSSPGTRHYVTGYSCDCRGFMAHQRCKHHSTLLAEIGWLDADPEPPAPGASVTVSHSEGHYAETGWLIGNGCPEWNAPVTKITIDEDNSVRIVGDDFDTEVHWLENGHVIDDLTGVAPTIGHYDTTVHWIRSLSEGADVAALLQHAGLFPDGVFTDDRDDSDDGDERRAYGD